MNLLKECAPYNSMNELNGVMIKFSIFNFINEYKPKNVGMLEYTSDGILVENDDMKNIRKLVADELITNNIGDEDSDNMVLTAISVCNREFDTKLSDKDVESFALTVINKANSIFTATSYMDGSANLTQMSLLKEIMSNSEMEQLKILAIKDVIGTYLEVVEHKDSIDETTLNVLINTACKLQEEGGIVSSPIQAALVACFIYFKRDLTDPKNIELFNNLCNSILESMTNDLTERMMGLDDDVILN